jgi:hypothetical protein
MMNNWKFVPRDESMKTAFASLILCGMIASAANADVITQWNFEGDTTVASTGSGTASLVGGTTATFATGNGPGRGWNTTTYAAQSTGSGTRGVSFLTATAGFTDISLTFDLRASGTGSRWAQVDYTLDGGLNWTTGFWNNAGGLSPSERFTLSTLTFHP